MKLVGEKLTVLRVAN